MLVPRLRFFALLLLALVFVGDRPQGVDADAAHVPLGKFARKQALRFEANVGQVDAQARFVARRGGVALFLGDDRATLALRARDESSTVLTMRVAGGNEVVPVGSAPLATKTNYYVGPDPSQWHVDVPSFERVTYPGVREGIDLVFHGEEGQLEYDFIVAPGAEVASAALEIGGAESVAVNAHGDLAVETGRGTVLQYRPRVFQRDAQNHEVEVAANYKLLSKSTVGFEVASYDRSRPLVIDPVFSFATYLGGPANEEGNGVALDASGNAFVAGSATAQGYPGATASGPGGGGQDAYVAKLSPGNLVLSYSYIGGAGLDDGRAVAVDGNRVAVVGRTASNDFPTSANAFQTALGAGQDAFVTVLDGAGALVFSSYLDLGNACSPGPCTARSNELARGVAIRDQRVYVVGESANTAGGAGSTPTSTGLEPDGAFAFAFDLSAPTSPTYRRFLSGSEVIITGPPAVSFIGTAAAVTLDAAGNAYVVGKAGSSLARDAGTVDGFAAAPASYTTIVGNSVGGDAFAIRLSPTGSIGWRTFLGGSLVDAANAVAPSGDGQIVIAGETESSVVAAGTIGCGAAATDPFPTKLAYQSTHAGGGTGSFGGPGIEAFVARLDTNVGGAASLVFSTFLGGTTGIESGAGVGYDAVSNSVWVTGYTTSTNFPTVPAFTRGTNDRDAFLARLDANGTNLLESTLYGGTADDSGYALVFRGGSLAFAGTTASSDLALVAPVQSTLKGTTDAFLVRSGVVGVEGPPAVLDISPRQLTAKPGDTQQFIVTGGTGSYIFTLEPNASGGMIDVFGKYTAGARGGLDTIVVRDSAGAVIFATVAVQPPTPLFLTPRAAGTYPRGRLPFYADGGTAPYTFSVSSNPSLGSMTADGQYTAGSRGSVTDVIRVTDALGATLEATVAVGPGVSITPASASVPRKGTVTFSAKGGLGVAFKWSASAGTISDNGEFTAPNSSDPVTVTAKDPLGNTASVSVSVGGALALNPPEVSTVPGGRVTFSASGGKGSGYSFILLTSPPAGGTIDIASGEFVAGPTGNVSETVQVSDALGNRAVATITVGPAPATELPPPDNTSSSSTSSSSGASSSTSSGTTPPGNTSSTSTSGAPAAAPTSNVSVGGGDDGCSTSGHTPLASFGPIALGLLLVIRRRKHENV